MEPHNGVTENERHLGTHMSNTSSRFTRFATVVAGATAIALAGFAAAPAAQAGDPVTAVRLFGTGERANQNILMFNKWVTVLARYEQEKSLETQPCTGANCALQQWHQFVTGLQGQDRLAQLQAVNAYVNRTRFQADASRYGMVDYWATPREFLGRTGDCEDYAFAKYLSLKKLGWSTDQLRIVVMMHHGRRELHAVLVAYHGGTAYVLDNLLPQATDHRSLPLYQPIFSINETAWFHHNGWSPQVSGYSALPDTNETSAPAAAPMRRTLTARGSSKSFAANASEGTASLFTR